jgi:hypothetical protein
MQALIARRARLRLWRGAASLAMALLLIVLLLLGSPAPIISFSSTLPVIAIDVSGVSRSSTVNHRFAESLAVHLTRPAAPPARFEAFLWLQDDAAEYELEQLLVAEVALCVTRSKTLAQLTDRLAGEPPPGSGSAQAEGATIAADHPLAAPAAKSVWRADTSANTLHMLHKLRGVEWLRRHTIREGVASARHAFIIRLRPDLELQERLELPPSLLGSAPLAIGANAGRRVYVPWLCQQQRLCFDQLLLLPPEAAALLGELYEPELLGRTIARSSPPSDGFYPERLIWHALEGAGFEVTPLPARLRGIHSQSDEHEAPNVGLVLMAADGVRRDPLAKLARDFPACFSHAQNPPER